MAITTDFARLVRNRGLSLPTAIFALYLIIVLIALQVGTRKYHSLTRELAQWDGQHYLSIARDGYEMFPPTSVQPRITGNVGWFPLYPLTGRLVSLTGLSMPWSMVIASWLCLWLAMLVLYRVVGSKYNERTAVYTLAAMLIYPTSFYFATAFPYSLYLLLVSLAFCLLHARRYTFLIIPAAGLAVTYPSGALIGLPLTYYLIRYWKSLGRADRIWLMAAVVSIPGALFLFFLYYYFKFGDFFLYLTYQSQWFHGHKLTFPLLTLYNFAMEMPLTNAEYVMAILTLSSAVLAYSRKVEFEWQLYLIGILLFTPTFGTMQCYYRHVIVAFPLFLMLGLTMGTHRRRYIVGAYALASVVLAWWVFIPAFKRGLLM